MAPPTARVLVEVLRRVGGGRWAGGVQVGGIGRGGCHVWVGGPDTRGAASLRRSAGIYCSDNFFSMKLLDLPSMNTEIF